MGVASKLRPARGGMAVIYSARLPCMTLSFHALRCRRIDK